MENNKMTTIKKYDYEYTTQKEELLKLLVTGCSIDSFISGGLSEPCTDISYDLTSEHGGVAFELHWEATHDKETQEKVLKKLDTLYDAEGLTYNEDGYFLMIDLFQED